MRIFRNRRRNLVIYSLILLMPMALYFGQRSGRAFSDQSTKYSPTINVASSQEPLNIGVRENRATDNRTINSNSPIGVFAPPSVFIHQPGNGEVISSTTVLVFVSASGGTGGIASVMVNGQAATFNSSSGGYTITLTAPGEGPFTVSVTATDMAGNVSAPQTCTAIVDLTPPVLNVDSPADGGIVTTMPFNVTGTFSDVGGLSALTVNGKPATISGNTFASTIDELCDGPFPINVVATDKPARSTTVSLNVSVAIATRTNPCVSSIGPAVGSGFFVVDPNDPNTILTLGGPTQVMKTTDGGATWASVATGLSTNIPAVAIARNTTAPDTIYLGLSPGGVVKSTTGGTQFHNTGPGLSGTNVSALTVDPVDSNVVYVGVYSNTVFRTTDGGTTWTSISNGLPSTNNTIHYFTIDPNNTATIYMATDIGIFKSTNRGDLWKAFGDGVQVNGSPVAKVLEVAIEPDSSLRLYVSMASGVEYASSDGGANWHVVNTDLLGGNVGAIRAHPSYHNNLYSGAFSQGVYRSIDDGGTWKRFTNTLANFTVDQYYFFPSSPDRMYVHADRTIYFVKLPADITPPVITINRPTDGSFLNNRSILVAGRVADNDLGTGVAWVAINGTPAALNVSTGVFSANLMAPGDGPFQVSVQATDNAGNTSNPVINSVNVDTTGPAITIDSPAEGASVSGPTITVTGTLSDSGQGIATVAVNKVPAKITGNTYTAILDAQCNSGAITIEATAVDKANNTASVMRNINVMTAATPKPCALQTGPAGGNVLSLAVDKINAGILYAGTESDGIFKSIDNGLTWSAINNGITVPKINALSIDNVDSRNLYAGTSQGIFKTTDSGQTWIPINAGLPTVPVSQIGDVPASVSAVVPSPTNINIVYAVVSGGIYKTTDGGVSWMLSQNGITPVSGISSIAISPGSPDTIYAGMAGFTLVFKSTDAGNSWTSKSNGIQGGVFSLAVDPNDSQTVYAGSSSGFIYKTVNGGSNWVGHQNTLATNSVITSITIKPSSPNTIWAGTSLGVFLSADGGTTWTDFNNGLPAQPYDLTNALRYPAINAASLSSSSPGILYVATPFGVFKTQIDTADWKSIDSGLNNSTVLSITFDPVNKSTLYAVTTLGVFKSINRGVTWTDANLGLPPLNISISNVPYLSPVTCIAVDRNNPNVLYAGLRNAGVYKSIDGGQTWNASNTEIIGHHSVSAIVIDPDNSNTIYVGHESGFQKSTDRGLTWSAPQFIGPALTSIVIDPLHTDMIYVSSQFGLYKSINRAASWNSIQAGLPDSRMQSLAIDPSVTSTLYAGATGGSGIFKSVDGGAHWVSIKNGIIGIPAINALAVDPANPNFIYAATSTGLYKGTSGGAKWELIDTGFGSNQLNTLAFDPTDANILYLGTNGSGVVILQQQKDVTSPSIVISSPIDGSATNNPKINVTGIVKDNIAGSGVSGVTVNGSPAVYDNTTDTFSAILTATQDGPFIVSAQATDNAGNVGPVVTSTVILDRKVPTITIDSPANGAIVNAPTLTVTGTVNDIDAGIASVNVNGVAAAVNGNTYTATINTPCSQSLRITAIAADKGNNTAAAAVDVTVSVNSPDGSCWTSDGPKGGTILSIAVDPTNENVIYTGTANGVFKTINGGVSWQPANVSISGLIIKSLAIDSSNTQIIYAGTSSGRIFKTVNGGISWTEISLFPVAQSPIYSLIISPTNSSVVYAAAGSKRLLITTDGGLNWKQVGNPPFASAVTAMAVDPKNPNNVYVASARNVYISRDGGDTWTPSQISSSISNISELVTNPDTPSIIFAGTSKGMFRSSDSGVTWSQINTGLNAIPIFHATMDPNNPLVLYVSSIDGISRTTDGGNTWNLINTPPDGSQFGPIVVSRLNSSTIFAGTDNNFFESIDNGLTWLAQGEGLRGLSLDSIASDPAITNNVYAGSAFEGVYKSSSGGSTWSFLKSSEIIAGARILIVAPSTPTTIYAGATNGLFRSTDSGATWALVPGINPQFINSLAIDPGDPNIIYLGLIGSFVKTTDGGQIWKGIGGQISSFLIPDSIVIDQSNHNKVYATNSSKMYRSNDGGTTWTQMVNPLALSNGSLRLALDPAHPGTIYESTDFGGPFKSTDNGLTWAESDSGLPPFISLPAVVVDTGNTSNLYLALSDGTYKSTDGGASWNRLTAVLPNRSFQALALDTANTNIIYQAAVSGVFRLAQPVPTTAAVPFLTGLSQPFAQVGAPVLHLKIFGVNFTRDSIARWNGSARPTVYLNSISLAVDISPADLSTPGPFNITVNTDTPGGGVSNSLLFVVTKPNAGLTVGNLIQVYDGSPKTVTVTTTPANLTGITVTYNGSNEPPVNAGIYQVMASLDNPAYVSTVVFGTLVISKASQNVAFQPLSDKSLYDAPFQLNATASSGLPVTYQAQGGVSISGNTVTITGAGIATITAFQIGNNNYDSAATVSQTFTVNNPSPQILRLNPGAIIAGSGQTTIKIFGSNFVTDSLVSVNGVNSPATFVNRIEMDVQLSAADVASPGTKTITVSNFGPGGGNSIPITLKIISITSSDSKNVQPGTSETVSNAPTQSGDAGITAQLNHSASANGPANVTVQHYSDDPLGGSGLIDAGGGYVDLKVTGAAPDDTLNATFYYGSNVTGANEDKLQLLYFNGTKWAKVKSSGNTDPVKNTTDNQDGTVSGGSFTVVFDETSSPKLSQLNGTIFSSTPGLYGDLNNDITINVSDLLLMANFLAGNTTVDKTAGDLNQDNKITVSDLLTLANYLAGNVAHLPLDNVNPPVSNPADLTAFEFGVRRAGLDSWSIKTQNRGRTLRRFRPGQ